MTHLAGQELTKLKIGLVSLHGNVPARKRGELIAQFGGSRLQGLSFDRCWRSGVELAGGLGSRDL